MVKIVAFDLETSGFRPDKDEVLEIGAVAYFPSTSERRFFKRLILNRRPIHKKAIQIHGLSSEYLRDHGAVTLQEAMKDFVDFCSEDCHSIKIVGHNIMRFDMRFLEINLGRTGLALPRVHSIHDTYIVERRLVSTSGPRRGRGLGLKDCCLYRGIPVSGKTHRALYDSYLALRLYRKQWKQS